MAAFIDFLSVEVPLLAMLAILIWGLDWTHRYTAEHEVAPPRASDVPRTGDDAEWLLFPFRFIAGLAVLAWCAVGALVFMSPLLFLAWLVLR